MNLFIASRFLVPVIFQLFTEKWGNSHAQTAYFMVTVIHEKVAL